MIGAAARAVMPVFRQLFVGDPAGSDRPDEPRAARVHRAQAHRARGAANGGRTSRASRAAPSSTRGCSPRRSSPQFFPDLVDERVESAIALVHSRFSHEHVPVVAARSPVPLHRAQRRDQHGAGQPQLDAGPRGVARRSDLIPGDLERIFPICHARGSRHRELRRGARAAAPRRALAAARGAHDDPGGVGEPRVDEPPRSAPSTGSTRR